ncbi:MAG: CRISPR-associated endonuclease Cas1 [Phormidesmis sp. RL_2_1]|nr:CRISPR-associated endonuclease Cas1 [Phormidesmis sp. RL_2_1]
MSTVYLVQQGGVVAKKQGRFQFKVADEPQQDIPVREISKMLLYGNIHLTTPVISTCLYEHIPVFFLSQSGKYKGHLWSAQIGELTAELAQFERYGNEGFRLEMARAIVRSKLLNSKQLLLRLNRKRHSELVAQAVEGTDADLRSIEHSDSVDQLRGYEGSAAARYFPALGQLLQSEDFALLRRTRRPPTDPINALLSFGYTLLYNNVLSFILVEGLNPYLGNLHRSERKETHLAFDLMEAFRSPVVDSMVLRLVNQRMITAEDFQPPAENGAVYLRDAARRVFLQQFEARLSAVTAYGDRAEPVEYRRAMQLQVQDYKRAMMAGVAYEPFLRAV